jgi:hypothetical protein
MPTLSGHPAIPSASFRVAIGAKKAVVVARRPSMTAKPKRESFFAHRLVRLLYKTCAILEIGEHAVLLIIHIAHTEDAIRYSQPARFWNSQLDSVLGFKSPKQLNTARQRAIDAGWLQYERENDRQVGLYWTDIPSRFEALNDAPIENECFPNSEHEAENKNAMLSENGTRSGTQSGKPSIPNPKPIKSGRTAERFIPPSVQEVQEYAKTEGLRMEAERFVDYFESVGWVIGKGKPMKSWRAAAKNWARTSQQQTPKTTQQDKVYVN